MSLPSSSPGRALLIAGMLVLALAACGRRGSPEAPLTAAEIAAQQQDEQRRAKAAAEEAEEGGGASGLTPLSTARRRPRGYTIPQEPFILDPLL